MPGTVLYVGKLSPITTYADIHAFFTGFEM